MQTAQYAQALQNVCLGPVMQMPILVTLLWFHDCSNRGNLVMPFFFVLADPNVRLSEHTKGATEQNLGFYACTLHVVTCSFRLLAVSLLSDTIVSLIRIEIF
jgi:hypothetical protein